MKLSVITPTYNSFSNMKEYFNCLEKQTYKNFEVVIIDDCSTDDSYKKLLEYKKNSPLDIKLVKNKKNTGPGLARNFGLNFLTGDYVTFIDSDDYIREDSLEIVINILKKNKVDCLIFDFVRIIGSKKKYNPSIPGISEGYVDKRKAIAVSTGSTWCKVYSSNIIQENEIKFPDLLRFEDMVFNKIALSYCENIFYLKENLYFYVNNENSIVNVSENHDEKFVISAFDILKSKIPTSYSNELEAIFVREVLYTAVLIMVSRGVDKELILKEFLAWEENYPNWSSNEYIKYFSKHQKVCLFFIEHKIMSGLRVLSYLKFKKINR